MNEESENQDIHIEVLDRIEAVIKSRHSSISAFADSIGRPRSTVSDMLKRQSWPNGRLLYELKKKHPDVDINQILMGFEGSASMTSSVTHPGVINQLDLSAITKFLKENEIKVSVSLRREE